MESGAQAKTSDLTFDFFSLSYYNVSQDFMSNFPEQLQVLCPLPKLAQSSPISCFCCIFYIITPKSNHVFIFPKYTPTKKSLLQISLDNQGSKYSRFSYCASIYSICFPCQPILHENRLLTYYLFISLTFIQIANKKTE